MPKKFLLLVACSLLLIHLFLLVNLRFEAWPEVLMYPYLNNNGFLQYKDIIHPYPPLPIWLLSGFFKVVGLSVGNLQRLTWALILGIDALVFFIARKKYGSMPAFIALAFFVIGQPLLDGNGLWFDLMLTPILLGAFYFQSPLLLSLAFFTKQSVLWIFPLFFKKAKLLLFSIFSLFLVSCFLFLLSGTLKDYLFWAWRVPLTLYPFLPGQRDLGQPRLWIIALLPFVPLLLSKRTFSRGNPFWWCALSFLMIFPRFGLFHLQPALAFAALALAQSWKTIKKSSRFGLFLIPYSLFLIIIWRRQIMTFWHQPTRFFESGITQAGQRLATNTNPVDPIMAINAPDQIFITANRLPPKPWVDTFPWYLEIPGIQAGIIQRYQQQNIQGVIWSPYQQSGKFIPGSYMPLELQQYVDQNFPTKHQLNNNTFLLKFP